MSSNLSYHQAKSIAAELAGKTTKAAQLLDQMVKDTGRYSTFIIMRYGDPRKWDGLSEGPVRGEHLHGASHKRVLAGRPPILRDVSLRHIETGKLIKSTSARGLIKEMGLDWTQILHVQINHLTSGRRNSVDGWYLAPVLDTKVELKDQYGNAFKPMTIRELALDRGIKVGSALALATGKKRFFQGLALASTPIDSVLRPRNWRFTEIAVKKGAATVRAKSIPALALKLGIAPADLYQMAYGFKTREDMEIVDVEIERKTALPALA